jgi:hypothetical protein
MAFSQPAAAAGIHSSSDDGDDGEGSRLPAAPLAPTAAFAVDTTSHSPILAQARVVPEAHADPWAELLQAAATTTAPLPPPTPLTTAAAVDALGAAYNVTSGVAPSVAAAQRALHSVPTVATATAVAAAAGTAIAASASERAARRVRKAAAWLRRDFSFTGFVLAWCALPRALPLLLRPF